MCTSILLSTHTTTITMGRAAKLKRRRKQLKQQHQQQQLTEIELSDNSDEQHLTESAPEIDPQILHLIDCLVEDWSTVPHFAEDFTFNEAEQIAAEALYLFMDASVQNRTEDFSLERQLSTRFTINLSFCLKPLSVKTLIADNLDQKIFELTTKFRLQ